jgi:hypothetical protein
MVVITKWLIDMKRPAFNLVLLLLIAGSNVCAGIMGMKLAI